MALGKEYGELYGAQRDELMEALREVLDRQGRGFAARGVTGRAKTEAGQRSLDNLLRQLSTIKGGYGVAELGRKQQVSDVAEQRDFQTKMTYAEYAERKKAREEQFRQQKELMALQETFARDRESRQKKDARKNMIRQAVIGIGTGAAAGAFMPAAVGTGSAWKGAARGAIIGAPQVAAMQSFNWMYPKTQRPGVDSEYDIDYSRLMPGIRPRKLDFNL